MKKVPSGHTFNVGEKYLFMLGSIPRLLEVKDKPQTFKFYRKNESPHPIYSTLALIGDRENNNYFIWLENAVDNLYINGSLKS